MSLPPFWKQVQSQGLQVPDERPLDDLTAELTAMLGSVDPAIRDGLAYPALATWLGRGVYDDLLRGLGDGIAAGLSAGVGEVGADSVFRRSYSVLVLTECVARDNVVERLPADILLGWGDRVATWYLREKDLRGYVPGKGWAHAVAHGADAIGRFASSRHLGAPELTVLLDVLADRLLAPGPLLVSGEPDRMAQATLQVLRRDLVPLRVLEPWVARLLHTATARVYDDRDPHEVTGNAEAFLRSLHLQLALAPQPPAVRADLLLVLVDALRASNHHYLSTPPE